MSNINSNSTSSAVSFLSSVLRASIVFERAIALYSDNIKSGKSAMQSGDELDRVGFASPFAVTKRAGELDRASTIFDFPLPVKKGETPNEDMFLRALDSAKEVITPIDVLICTELRTAYPNTLTAIAAGDKQSGTLTMPHLGTTSRNSQQNRAILVGRLSDTLESLLAQVSVPAESESVPA